MRYILIGIFSVLIGYSSEWVPYYCGMILGDQNLQVFGGIDGFERGCTESERGEGICRHQYEIPLSLQSFGHERMAVGVGSILSASDFTCEGSKHAFKTYDDPTSPGRLYDGYNVYQFASFDKRECSKSVIIRAWSRPGARRHGYTGGRMTIGSETAVIQVAKLVDFLNRDIKMVLTVSFLVCLGFAQVLKKIRFIELDRNVFEEQGVYWIGFLLVSSGLIQIAVPILASGFYSRLSGFLSMVAHISPALFLLEKRFNADRKLLMSNKSTFKLSGLTVLALACTSPQFGHLFFLIMMLTTVVGIGVAIHSKSVETFIFYLLMGSDVLKTSNIANLPHSHTATIFASVSLLFLTLGRIRTVANLLRAVEVGPDLVKSALSEDFGQVFLARIADQVKVDRVTLIEPTDDGECIISICERRTTSSAWQTNSFVRMQVPLMASHVMTTGHSIFHLKEDSEEYTKITRGAAQKVRYNAKIFSLVNLLSGGNTVGILCFTDYPSKLASDSDERSIFLQSVNLLEPYIVESINKRRSDRALDTKKRHYLLNEIIKKLQLQIVNGEITEFGVLVAQLLNDIVPFASDSAFLGRLNHDTRSVEVLSKSGYLPGAAERLEMGAIYAHPENMRGPLPLAVNTGEIVIVSDLRFIQSHLHPASLDLLLANGAESIAAIPIFEREVNSVDGGERTSKVWGVVWLESRERDGLSRKDQALFELLQEHMTSLIAMVDNSKKLSKYSEMLDSFMPEWAKDALALGEEPVEFDNSFLLMIDLRFSSKIASHLGDVGWNSFIKEDVEPRIRKMARSKSLNLQTVVWDAFFFTPDRGVEDIVVKNICAFVSDVREFIYKAYSAKLYQIVDFQLDFTCPIRACLVYGDSSRGLSSPPGRKWTIVGSAMALVMKLEDQCKGLSGMLFVNTDMLKRLPGVDFEDTGQIFKVDGGRIFRVVFQTESLIAERAA